jgi:GNAT superfamily N-acetyltransferase
MQITEIDVHDDAQVEAFWSAAKESDEFERPYAVYWSLPAALVAYRTPSSSFERHPFTAVEDGAVIGTNQVMLPQRDNTHIAYMGPGVRPSHRGRGIGAALLEHGLEFVRSSGRSTVIIEVNRPMTESGGPGECAARTMLVKYGFTDASVELHRVLDLPVPADRLDELDTETSARRGDYRIIRFAGTVPDELMAGYCHLQEAFNSEAPLGDLDIEPEVWDVARVREREDLLRRSGRYERAAAAVAPDGAMVALTEMMTTEHQPELGWQSGTLVLREHRGHGLGMAIKVANLRAFQAEFPQVRVVHSWNAEENGPMVAINDRLGFRPVEYLVEMQLKL